MCILAGLTFALKMCAVLRDNLDIKAENDFQKSRVAS